MVRFRSILASNGNFVRTPLRASRDVTAKAFVVAVLAILTLAMPGRRQMPVVDPWPRN